MATPSKRFPDVVDAWCTFIRMCIRTPMHTSVHVHIRMSKHFRTHVQP